MVDCINRPWMARTGTPSTSTRSYHSRLHPPPQRPRTTTVSSRVESSFILPLDSHREYFTKFPQKKLSKRAMKDWEMIDLSWPQVFQCSYVAGNAGTGTLT